MGWWTPKNAEWWNVYDHNDWITLPGPLKNVCGMSLKHPAMILFTNLVPCCVQIVVHAVKKILNKEYTYRIYSFVLLKGLAIRGHWHIHWRNYILMRHELISLSKLQACELFQEMHFLFWQCKGWFENCTNATTVHELQNDTTSNVWETLFGSTHSLGRPSLCRKKRFR